MSIRFGGWGCGRKAPKEPGNMRSCCSLGLLKFADYCGKIRRIMLHNLEFAGQSPCLTSRTCDASSVLAIDPGIGICHLESFSTPNGPVNHFMAVKSVSFEAICGSSGVLFSRNVKKTLHNRLVSDTKDSLPGYATQIVLTANICYRSVHCLFPMDWLLSLRYCQDMLRKDSQNMHKVAYTLDSLVGLDSNDECSIIAFGLVRICLSKSCKRTIK